MPHRLSPPESRRLVRQILSRDEPQPRDGMLSASGTGQRFEPARPPLSTRGVGPYESDYEVCDGYTMERTVIVP